ncbi:MAG: DUF6785 family protein [Armatimonadota bacterium]|nr:hypothetical protein [Armatimonadota bacterium]MCX7777693.1 hypothetical protein [Armatimonadota bacterium]MDW8025452.1 DUF6785 family protein [Armatimonadota bacterium]
MAHRIEIEKLPLKAPAEEIEARNIAMIIAWLLIPPLVMWIHHAEIRLGGLRGHTALANTALPVGAFFTLCTLVLLNSALARIKASWRLRQCELILIYAVLASTTVIASSGGMHFLVPALTAPVYYASPVNNWEELFWSYIPTWFAPQDREAIRMFYIGGTSVPIVHWLLPMAVWSAFTIAIMLFTLSLCILFKRQWIERERLTFPTVVLPVELTKPGFEALRNRSLWLGFIMAFVLGSWNTLSMNYPSLPMIDVRGTRLDVGRYLTDRPWNAIGSMPMTFYPFIIGIGYLLSLEVTFSCWLFYFITKLEAVFCEAIGISQLGRGGISRYPYIAHQGAGAFLAIALLSVWIGRTYLAQVLQTILGKSGTAQERKSLIIALAMLISSFSFLIFFARAAGMRATVGALLFALSFTYMLSATRLRAEAGNAWLFGPHADPYTLVTTTLGTNALTPRELTIMAYFRNIASFDLRCLPMPHQMDALKMSGMINLNQTKLLWGIIIGTLICVPTAFYGALSVWYNLGAAGKADVWRVYMGREPFTMLESFLRQPVLPDIRETIAVAIGFMVTCMLTFARAHLLSIPTHPFGYAVANTATMHKVWLPFMISWAFKGVLLRYFGTTAYRRALPFFLGLILGDFAHGGLWTLVGCFVPNMRVYPMNW